MQALPSQSGRPGWRIQSKQEIVSIRSLLFLLFWGVAFNAWCSAHAAPLAVNSVHKESDGVVLTLQQGVLKLRVFSPRIIELQYTASEVKTQAASLAVIGKPVHANWNLFEMPDGISVRTENIEVRVNRQTGAVGFYDTAGKALLLEKLGGGKSLNPTSVGGVDTLSSEQAFELAPDEAIYGLGQHAQGAMNYRGATVHLQQRNPTESAVPVLVSSRGYGVLWDNPAVTDVDVGHTDARLVTWKSEAADAIHYYFMYGPELDGVVADYRQLTGAAPMMGEWAFGFWQCKARYKTQQELLDVAAWYRTNHVPLDGVIQDWQYWNPNPWGSHMLATNRYPNPAQMMKKLHAEHVHLLISVWPKFDVDSANANELRSAGAFYPQVLPYVYPKGEGQWYDPFNARARTLYWEQISQELFSQGIDGWWLDASEAELSGKWGEFRNFKTAEGPGAKVFNAYPLMHTAAVYEGQRAENSQKRVFILTRSAYAGQQRNAAVTWSGDIHSDWKTFVNQIPAGLNFSISGIPYWNSDTGGFFNNYPTNAAYAELFTRWFQFSAFCPMFRVHGIGEPKEIWRFPENTQRILIAYDRLRYHLLPYIYSVSWRVTSEGYTMLRPLVMDYRTDTNVFSIPDQFQLGADLMACPVTKSGATRRSVYLPSGREWIDFWTGEKLPGGQKIEALAPVETMPLYVPAGTILPYGPDIEYAGQSADPIELRVYRGADASFNLYEDEGDGYNYEKGSYSTIPIRWNQRKHTLTIGALAGSFPGMLKERTFRVVWVSTGHGVGIASTEKPDLEVKYSGSEIEISDRP